MSWKKLALVQLVQKIFTQKSGEADYETKGATSAKKQNIVKTQDEVETIQQASLKETAVKSSKKDEKESKMRSQTTVKKAKSDSKTQTKSTKRKTAPKKDNQNEKKETKRVKSTKKSSTKKSLKSDKEPISKKQQKLKLYHEDIKKHLGSVDEAFLEIIVKNLGPSIYRKDAESVACSDPKELETVKNNFLVKKLQMPKDDKEALDKAVAEVCEKLKGVKTKYRATFYYMLAKNLKKESMLS